MCETKDKLGKEEAEEDKQVWGKVADGVVDIQIDLQTTILRPPLGTTACQGSSGVGGKPNESETSISVESVAVDRVNPFPRFSRAGLH